MDTNRWLRLKEIFRTAQTLGPEECKEYLEEACGDETKLRHEVETLLASHEESSRFLELPTDAGLLAPGREEKLASTRIGQYLLERVISSGGMGTVYEAIQESPRRTVAIKVMREGIASPSILRRFEYEAEILARLTHPHIAQVIEAGTHCEEGVGEGRDLPYFVMEYIQGARSITEYAWEEGLTRPERLELFLQVCDAVHHGHRKGIIHRDLKPSNILVDGSGQVKIIDFGVARTTDSDLRLTTVQTEVGQLIGTLQYMSPEQCKADPHDLDIRSDIYSLGVVLYELLCEELPYNVEKAAVFEATRMIRETDPKKPSTTRAALRGDVETILLKALEKDRTRRYQSAVAFADDLQRYLSGEVILARPVGPATKAWKVVKRNPVVSAAVGVALLAMVTFVGYILLVSYPALREERDATKKEKEKAVKSERKARASEKKAVASEKKTREALEVAELRREQAVKAQARSEREAKITRQINLFLKDMLDSPNPARSGRDVRVVDVLDEAAADLETAFFELPEIEASLRYTIGWVYYNLDQSEKAEPQIRAAVEILKRIYVEGYHKTLWQKANLGLVLMSLDRLPEAEAVLREVVEFESSGPDDEDPDRLKAKLVAGSYLAHLLKRQRNYSDAEAMIREVMLMQDRLYEEENVDTLYSKGVLASILNSQARFSDAEAVERDLLEDRRRVLGEDHPSTLTTLSSLGLTLQMQGKETEAEPILRDALELHIRVFGEEFPSTLIVMDRLGMSLRNRGALTEAETLLRKAVEISRRIEEEENRDRLSFMNNLASVLAMQEKLPEAKRMFQKVLDIRRRTQGDRHPFTIGAMSNVANVSLKEGNHAEAESMQREILALFRQESGLEHPNTLHAMITLGSSLAGQGKFSEAEELYREILEIGPRVLAEEHRLLLSARLRLANSYKLQSRFAEALPIIEKGLEIIRNKLPEGHVMQGYFLVQQGDCLLNLKRFPEAEAPLQEGLKIYTNTLGENHKTTRLCRDTLIKLYEAWGKPEKDDELRLEPGEDEQ